MSSIKIVLPGESLAVNPKSSGFAHGFGLFETIRLRAGRIELWAEHWQRLTRSARQLGIACPFEKEEALEALRTLAGKLPPEAILKLSLLKAGKSSQLVVYSRPVQVPPEDIGLLVDGPCRIDEASPLTGHKTHNYLENLLVLESARERACFDALRLNSKGEVAEGAISNIFFVRNGTLHTPCPETGLLPGVIRGKLIEILKVEQGSHAPSELMSAEAVFLTNASIGLQPVDWLLSAGKKIQLASRQHDCFEHARRLLADRIEATAVQI